ncbi:hypothetical protein SteCoe_6577 [Stentor coeruleus]|uniref:SAM domain-containing protein n=1 Tax=Stentor coeruleus TaxID=5963 RepID=A0A1R2BNC2_9CILI|nr:hypothetical protein SteCoe_21981 [Stentor coeruleus]OMJ91003.1 hypothetical protein SteCoe_6577 [Stentor coeruleus]
MEESHLIELMNEACLKNDIKELNSLLQISPHLISQTNSKLGWSALYQTVICGHLEATKLLLQYKAEPNAMDSNNRTVLHHAIDSGQYNLVKLLLLNKADPNIMPKGTESESCLHIACSRKDDKIVKLLLEYKADPNIINSNTRKTPLHYAVEASNKKLVKILLDYNANPYYKDFSEKSPLDYANDEIRNQIAGNIRSKNEETEKSTKNSPLLFPLSDTVEDIPSIPLDSFYTSPVSAKSSKPFDTFENPSFVVTTPLEPDAENPQLERASKAFSFGGNGAMLMTWLESVKLEFLYDLLMMSGYDDIEQNIAQMMSSMPITEDMLEDIGIDKPGYRKRLLAALDEDARPLKYSRRRHRHHQSTPIGCCTIQGPSNYGMIAAPDLKHWLGSLNMQAYYDNFEKAGYEDLEHLLALMNSKWPITENELIYDIGVVKQGHRFKILAALRSDSSLFVSFKKSLAWKKDDVFLDRTTKTQACGSCSLM